MVLTETAMSSIFSWFFSFSNIVLNQFVASVFYFEAKNPAVLNFCNATSIEISVLYGVWNKNLPRIIVQLTG